MPVVKRAGTSALVPFVGDAQGSIRPRRWIRRVVVALALTLLAASSVLAQTTRTVTAAWDANTDTLTRGYIVYYGTASGSYQWSHDAGMQTSTPLTLSVGSQYFFVVRAYDASSNLGPASNQATFDLRVAAPTAQITATLSGTSAVVTWSTTNAVSARINNTTVNLSGTMTVPVSATTTFTIVAANAAGTTATQSATVTVPPPTSAPTASLTASLQNGTTAVLNWTTTNATSAAINGTAVAVNGTLSGPVSATTTFRLVATGPGGTAESTATVTVTPPVSAVPNAPTNTTSSVSGSLARIGWRAPTSGPALTSYLLDVGSKSGLSDITAGVNVGNVLGISGNLPRGRYYARVRALNSAGASAPSPETNFWVGKKLVSPSGFTVRWEGTTATLSWSQPVADAPDVENPSGYVLEVGMSPGQTSVAVPMGNVRSFSAPVPSGTYYVRVRAVSPFGQSDPTPELVITPPGGPGTPTGLTASWSAATVTLRWQAPSSGGPATAYQLEAGSAPGLADLAVVQIGNVLSFSSPVPPGTYYLRVRAVNGRGPGPVSNEVVLRR